MKPDFPVPPWDVNVITIQQSIPISFFNFLPGSIKISKIVPPIMPTWWVGFLLGPFHLHSKKTELWSELVRGGITVHSVILDKWDTSALSMIVPWPDGIKCVKYLTTCVREKHASRSFTAVIFHCWCLCCYHVLWTVTCTLDTSQAWLTSCWPSTVHHWTACNLYYSTRVPGNKATHSHEPC